MFPTYTVQRSCIAELQEKLKDVRGMTVEVDDTLAQEDQGFAAVFEIDFESRRFQLSVFRPTAPDNPLVFSVLVASKQKIRCPQP